MNRKKRKEGGGEDGEIDEDEKKEGEVKEGSFYLTVFAISRGFNTEYLRTI